MGERALRDGRGPATGLRRGLRDAASGLGVTEWRRPLRTGTAGLRPAPDFLVIGAQKSGTTTIYDYLLQHPDVRSALRKEVHYFDRAWGNGDRWYRAHFPAAAPGRPRSWLTGEATPYYLLDPRVPVRIAQSAPDARLVAVLRHPVDRAYSGFQHSRALGLEPEADFGIALDLETERTAAAWDRLVSGASEREPAVEAFSYLRRGRYAEQLRRWDAAIRDPSQLLVVLADELFTDPQATMTRVLSHLGLSVPGPRGWQSYDFGRRNARQYTALPDGIRARLAGTFAADVAELEQRIGRATGWHGL